MINATVISKTYIHVQVKFLSNPSYGFLSCCASKSQLTAPSYYQIKSTGQTLPFVNISNHITIIISNLRPITDYFIYCGYLTNDFVTTPSNIIESHINVTTLCCIDVILSNSPNVVYNDLSQFKANELANFIFNYNIAYLPLPGMDIRITPSFKSASLQDDNLLLVSPKSILFTSESKLIQGSVIFTAPIGTYSMTLNVSGAGAQQYIFSSIESVEVLDPKNILPPPNIISTRFADGGSSVTILFDRETNRAGMTSNYFKCSLFLFSSIPSLLNVKVNG